MTRQRTVSTCHEALGTISLTKTIKSPRLCSMTTVASPHPGSLQHGSKHENRPQYEIPHLPYIVPKELVSAQYSGRSLSAQINGYDGAYNLTPADSPGSTSPTRSETAHAPLGSQEALAQRPNRKLLRANTDYGPRRQSPSTRPKVAEENWELRHGWEDQYNSSEYLGLLSSVRI